MPRIGLRELKTHISEVLRDVQENGTRYSVTNRGEPIAVLVPYSAWDEKRPMSPEELTTFLDDLAQKIGEASPGPWSVADMIDELR
jgi:prevent-host-death family protein